MINVSWSEMSLMRMKLVSIYGNLENWDTKPPLRIASLTYILNMQLMVNLIYSSAYQVLHVCN